MKAFYLYMMTNQSRVVLYTGITNSLVRRVWQHQNGEIEGFTKPYKVNRLVYYECFDDPRDAIAREKEIKGWRREKKNALAKRRIRSGRIYHRCSFSISNLPRVLQQLQAGNDDRRQFVHSPCFARSLAPLGMTGPTM